MAKEDPTPPRIRRLDEAVVNRIAAGEIIQRPANALKEMLENSLDAGATQISVTVREGGNKLLQIQDNGHGIQLEDLPLLCERHATSKLQSFEDLTGINTLGFRGEALASISFVAHMTVTTMLRGATHGYKVSYRDGVMDPAGPKPCAALPGTTIMVEDLYYNVPLRKKALKSASEEYNRILDVVGRYAIYKSGVSISCKRHGEPRSDVFTTAAASRLDNIRAIYGVTVARSLQPLQISIGAGEKSAATGEEDDELSFKVEGFLSTADYTGKNTILVLFINGRPVECSPLKRALEATYAAVLPKTAKPYFFLALQMPGEHVDVNVHPTKREVGFLHQEALIEALRSAVEQRLLASNNTRTYTQTRLPGAAPIELPAPDKDDEGASTRRDKAGGDHKLVRTDSRAQTLHSFLLPSGSPLNEHQQPTSGTPVGQSRLGVGGPSAAAQAAVAVPAARRKGTDRGVVRPREDLDDMVMDLDFEVDVVPDTGRGSRAGPSTQRAVRQRSNPAETSSLGSIIDLLEEVDADTHPGLAEVIRNHTHVGLADDTLGLIQHGTRLYLIDIAELSRDLFYQQVLRRFEHMSSIELGSPLRIRDLAQLGLELEEQQGIMQVEEGESREEVAALVERLLLRKGEMLREYLAMQIDEEAHLRSLPLLVDEYVPDLNRLPQLVLALARDVDWSREKECFQSLAQVLAAFYRVQEPVGRRANSTHAHTADAPETTTTENNTAGPPNAEPTVRATESEDVALPKPSGPQALPTRLADRPGENAGVSSAGGAGASSQDLPFELEEESDAAAAAAASEAEPTPANKEDAAEEARRWTIEHVVLPAMRSFLKPRKARAKDGTFLELTRLEHLYKVFERC